MFIIIKKFLIASIILVAIFSATNINTSAAEVNDSNSSGSQIIPIETESVDQQSQDIQDMVLKDMKEHPELVEYAKVDEPRFSVFSTVPYSFKFSFKSNFTSGHFSSFRGSSIKATLSVNSSKTTYVYLSLYKNGVFQGTRVYRTGKTSSGSFFNVGLSGDYNVYLTNSSDANYSARPTTSGSGTITAY